MAFLFYALYPFAGIGGLLVVYFIRRTLDFYTFHFTTPSRPLESYRRAGSEPTYALVTGGNTGIGYGIALSLVKHGFGVILLGRNSAKLDAAAERLREALVLPNGSSLTRNNHVKTIVLDVETATPLDIEKRVLGFITDESLDVSILVNNVGMLLPAYPPYRQLKTYSSNDINSIIDVNARFMTHLTAQMLPVLSRTPRQQADESRHGRSLILNISSGARIGLPYQVVYAATKAFNSAFSIGLARELKADPEASHVDVLAVISGEVVTQSNFTGMAAGTPDAETYGKYIVEKTDGAIKRNLHEIFPHWQQHLGLIIFSFMSDQTATQAIIPEMEKKRNGMNEATKPKEE
ncbi:Very-long-chain 3-oxoacyl-CoA reductase 1 [Paramyrothecium foliicola]|nr:Very-long-chain 3-oxoacyl-CoA reductase 1 [Paramyrothecium foliicola]